MKLFLIILLFLGTSCVTPKYYSVPTKDDPSIRVIKTKKEIKEEIHIIKKELRNERRRKNENGERHGL
jgi:hypothetical protein